MKYHYVWLAALSGVMLYGIPLEELLFGFAFGMYWTGVYEHLTWRRSAPHARAQLAHPGSPSCRATPPRSMKVDRFV